MKWMLRIAAALAVVLVGLSIGIRAVGHDPATWHVDPATAERTGAPNDYLVAPAGTTAAPPDRTADTLAANPRALLFLFDAIASNAPQTEVVAGSLDDLHITYVQRSLVFGFPDYISVRAVPVDGGSALIVWSRSRFGHSDMGVNRDRVERWLAQMGGPT